MIALNTQNNFIYMRLGTDFFFYASAFCVSKQWDPCYSSNTFSGMTTFSLNATAFSLTQ